MLGGPVHTGLSRVVAVRRLFITAVALLTGPAQAVDYVKCEAIQKAYGRLAYQQKQAGSDAYAAKLSDLCPYPTGATTDGGQAIVDSYKCRNERPNFQQAHAVREEAMNSFENRLSKIKADYNSEGCP